MPSDRIFTTREAGNLGDPQEINTIDYGQVEEIMSQLRDPDVPPAPSGTITKAAAKQKETELPESASNSRPRESAQRPVSVRTAGVCDICGVPHPCSHDITAAKSSGDEDAVALMKEVRNQRRLAHLAQHDAAVRYAQQAAAERRVIDAGIDELEAAVKQETQQPDKKPATSKSNDPEFQDVDNLTASQKDRFVKWAEKQGWPEEYVSAFLTPRTASNDIPEPIKVVASNNNIDKKTKVDLITSMAKEAKLDSEQANRIKKFWSEELGYQDTEWVDDLVAEPTGE